MNFLTNIQEKLNWFDYNDRFFCNEQKTLLWIANHKISRWLLGLNRLPKGLKKWKIVKVTPAGIHTQNKDGSFTTANFTRPRFAEALAFNLSPLAYLKTNDQRSFQWRFSPVGVLGMLVLGLFGGGFAIAGTTTNYLANGGDGGVNGRDSYSSWADARPSGAGQTAWYNVDYSWGASSLSNASGWVIKRTFFPIDTSGLDDAATISAASFFIYVAPNPMD
jgi:hypothetical protein